MGRRGPVKGVTYKRRARPRKKRLLKVNLECIHRDKNDVQCVNRRFIGSYCKQHRQVRPTIPECIICYNAPQDTYGDRLCGDCGLSQNGRPKCNQCDKSVYKPGYDTCWRHQAKFKCSNGSCTLRASLKTGYCPRHDPRKALCVVCGEKRAELGYDKCLEHGGYLHCERDGCTNRATCGIHPLCPEHGGIRCATCDKPLFSKRHKCK